MGSPERVSTTLALVVIAVATVAAFSPVLRADFVAYDDNLNYLQNPDYRGLSGEHLRWMFTTGWMGHYQPITWLTAGVDYVLWEMNAAGYHATSLLLHVLVAFAVFFATRRLLAVGSVGEVGAGARAESAGMAARADARPDDSLAPGRRRRDHRAPLRRASAPRGSRRLAHGPREPDCGSVPRARIRELAPVGSAGARARAAAGVGGGSRRARRDHRRPRAGEPRPRSPGDAPDPRAGPGRPGAGGRLLGRARSGDRARGPAGRGERGAVRAGRRDAPRLAPVQGVGDGLLRGAPRPRRLAVRSSARRFAEPRRTPRREAAADRPGDRVRCAGRVGEGQPLGLHEDGRRARLRRAAGAGLLRARVLFRSSPSRPSISARSTIFPKG